MAGPTPEQLQQLALAVRAATGDSGSHEERSADDVKGLLALAAEAAQDQSSNPQGGRRSAWNYTRKGIFSPGGGS